MGKRVKSAKPAIIEIKDWKQADRILREIGNGQLGVIALQRDAKGDVDDIKAQLAEDMKPVLDAIDVGTRSIEAFAANRKGEFGKARSRKLNFGTVGWRQSTSIKIKKTTTVELIREVLSAAKAKLCIIVKETVSKDGLGKLTDEELAELGARRKVKDDFFVEPDLPEVVHY